jgi:hypothetical protein
MHPAQFHGDSFQKSDAGSLTAERHEEGSEQCDLQLFKKRLKFLHSHPLMNSSGQTFFRQRFQEKSETTRLALSRR